MTVVHVLFHIIQGLIGSFGIYALINNALLIAVISLFFVYFFELFDGKIKEIDSKISKN